MNMHTTDRPQDALSAVWTELDAALRKFPTWPTDLSWAGKRARWAAFVRAQAARIAELEAERDALQVDAERYRFIRNADVSDYLVEDVGIYAMESLDQYVDAAMAYAARTQGAKP